jgi:hypothetical protein
MATWPHQAPPRRRRYHVGDCIERRPKLFPDHGIDLPKLVVQLGPADAQSDGVPGGGLLLSRPPRLKSVALLLDQAGKLVGAGNGDAQGLQWLVMAL